MQVAWRKAGRSLKGFGLVPEVIACALTVGFRVGKVRVPFIDRLGFLPKRYCIHLVGNRKCTKTQCFLMFLEEGRSFPEGIWVVPEVPACALTLGWGPSGPGPLAQRRRGKGLGSTPEGWWPGGRPVVPLRDLASFPKLLHALLL